MLESLFNKVTGLMARNLIRKRSEHACFSVNITKCLGKVFLMEHLKPLENDAAFCIKICMIQFLKDQISSISSDMYE